MFINSYLCFKVFIESYGFAQPPWNNADIFYNTRDKSLATKDSLLIFDRQKKRKQTDNKISLKNIQLLPRFRS